MEPRRELVLFILGPTATGKSVLAVHLAALFNGEIINGDSMQVYRGFDIGTDKPPLESRGGVPHHLLDILDPEAQYTAADFVRLAVVAIGEIRGRGRLPIVVGGTGLYLKALVDGLFPGPGRDAALRRKLEEEAAAQGLDSLYRRLAEVDPDYARTVAPRDKVRIIRALEVFALTGTPLSRHFRRTEPPLKGSQLARIGLKLERQELIRRIELRVDRMFERDIVDEVRTLLARGCAREAPPFQALGYRYVLRVLDKTMSVAEAAALTKRDTRQYAKRQMTWFRRMAEIVWFPAGDRQAAVDFVRDRLT